MLKKVISVGAKWVNGKWVKSTATETVETTSTALQNGKVYTKMKFVTNPVTKEVTHTRLPEGMLPKQNCVVQLQNKLVDFIHL